MIFTTSWDDGYRDDMRIADMLKRHGATGTFYVCPTKQQGEEMLTTTEIKNHDKEHEVGAHTIKHNKLSRIPIEEAAMDIQKGKKWIEEITERECTMFCYPCGDKNAAVRDAAVATGFQGARTVDELQFTSDDLFLLPTSLHLYPFPWRAKYTQWQHLFDPLSSLRIKWSRLKELHIPIAARRNWQTLARTLFLNALKTDQPFFHLWGHAYELNRYNSWTELDSFLEFVAKHPVEHLTNGQLVARLIEKK